MPRHLESALAPAGPNPRSVDLRAFAVMEGVARAMGGLVLAVGLLVLVGWWRDTTLLKSVRPTFVSMKPNTATAFVLAGLALLTFRRQQARPARWLTLGIPAAMTIIGALTLAEYLLGVNLRIDQLLFHDHAAVSTSPPGRMALTSALALVLMGSAILLTRQGTNATAQVAQALTLVAMLFSFVSFVSDLYGATTRYGFASPNHLAPHTLVAVLLIGVGVLASSPEVGLGRLLTSPSAGGLLLRRMLPLCLVVPVALGGLRLWGEHAGLYDTDLGLALFATARVVVVGALLVWVAGDLTAQHDRRLTAEAALREALDALEVRVLERTGQLARANGLLEQQIAERVAAQESLGRSEEMYRTLARSLPNSAIVLFDQDLRYQVADGAKLLTSLGLSQAQLVGKTFMEVARPENVAQLEPLYRAALRGETADLEVARGDNTLALHFGPVQGDSGSVTGGMLLIYDTTALKQAQAAAGEATSLWRAILDSTNYTMIATTLEGVIREFNAAAERMLGYSAGEVVGKVNPGIFHDPAEIVARAEALSAELGETIVPGADVFVGKARRGLSDENEWTYIRKDGSRLPVRLSMTALRDGAGQVSGFLGIASDITEQKHAREELWRATHALKELAHRDPLTSLLNRRGGSEVITRELERARRKATPIAVLLIDVDHFKQVNDSFGHQMGDLVLQAVARTVTGALRPYDIVVRWGGEEILVMAPDADAAGAAVIAERLRAAVEALRIATLPAVTISIGMAEVNLDEHDIAASVSRADIKMYEAKRAGRNCAR
jgi:diguanylate cyclase (GGDEF)-like protein/PAS domain S-box-containing protein